MKISFLLLSLSLVSGRSDSEKFKGPAVGAFKRPSSTDARSPCPMFNTMANHGYLRRDGGEMTKDDIITAFAKYASMDPTLTGFLLGRAFAKGVGNPAAQTLNLTSLRVHGLSEHDASLFRRDFFFGGDWYTRNRTLVNKLISLSRDRKSITSDHLANYRNIRYADSKLNNPQFVYNPDIGSTLFAEAGLFSLFLNPSNPDQIPISYIKAFADEERFPYKEGWIKKNGTITILDVMAVAKNIQLKADALLGITTTTSVSPKTTTSVITTSITTTIISTTTATPTTTANTAIQITSSTSSIPTSTSTSSRSEPTIETTTLPITTTQSTTVDILPTSANFVDPKTTVSMTTLSQTSVATTLETTDSVTTIETATQTTITTSQTTHIPSTSDIVVTASQITTATVISGTTTTTTSTTVETSAVPTSTVSSMSPISSTATTEASETIITTTTVEVTSTTTLAATTTAPSETALPPVGQYVAPASTDARSPCPMFNTMANHGFLRRDGGEMTMDEIITAFAKHASMDPTLTGFLLGRAFAKGVGNPAAQTLNLTSLRVHGLSEHDASLFRRDFFFGDDWFTRNSTLVKQLISLSADEAVITTNNIAMFRNIRFADSKFNNPQFVFNADVGFTLFAEAALFSLFLNPSNPDQIPVSFIRAFADEERLPLQEGWTKKDGFIGIQEVTVLAQQIQQKSAALASQPAV